MIYVRLNNVSLKYQRFEPLGCKDIGIINFQFVTKTQFLRNKDLEEKGINFCKKTGESFKFWKKDGKKFKIFGNKFK